MLTPQRARAHAQSTLTISSAHGIGCRNSPGVPHKPFHFRHHTAASPLAAEGVPLTVVQETLGHTLLSTTADLYSHLYPEAFQEAADAMERALSS